ncbi:MAG: hypothetical protein WCK90_03345 [archaeon]
MGKLETRVELIPGSKEQGTLVFKDRLEHDKWWSEFYASVKPALDRWDEARRKSWELAYHTFVYRK